MVMTLDEYIKNPMGKNNAVFSQRSIFKEVYTKKFDALIVRDAGKINYRLYKDTDRRYIMHFKIPSEIIAKFYYDVVIEFTASNIAIEAENTLKNYEVKFFSNDPAFVFTHAYSFAKNKLFIEDLMPKMSKRALTEKADIRNPKNVIGYVKTIYFAYIFIQLKGLDKKVVWLAESVPYVKKDLLAFVEDADKKVEARQLQGEQKAKEEKKKKNPTGYKPNIPSIGGNRSTKGISKTTVVNTHSMVKKTTTNKTVAHTKTTKRK